MKKKGVVKSLCLAKSFFAATIFAAALVFTFLASGVIPAPYI